MPILTLQNVGDHNERMIDKILVSFSEKPPAQKIIIAIAVSSFLLSFLGLTYIISTPNTVGEPSSLQNPTETKSGSIPTLVPMDDKGQPSAIFWPTYNGVGFKIDYPPTAAVRPGVIDGGQTGTSVVFEDKSEDSIGYSIEIQVTGIDKTPIEDVKSIFKEFRYKESQIIIGYINASKFSGNIKLEQSVLQDTAIIFADRGKVYKIQLDYHSPSANKEIEDAFSKIISTFRMI